MSIINDASLASVSGNTFVQETNVFHYDLAIDVSMSNIVFEF